MAKADLVREEVTRADCEALLSHYAFPFPLVEHKVLFGGYSGLSIRVVGTGGAAFVLKICYGYERADVEAQARVAVYARAHGFTDACTFHPLRQQPDAYSFERPSDRTPCCLLSWVDGTAADKVIAGGAQPAITVLRAVGAGLGRLHRVPPPAGPDLARLRACETDTGCCDIKKHLTDELTSLLATTEVVQGHPFLRFYAAQVAELREAFRPPADSHGLPRGVLHGDPFLDNVSCLLALTAPSSPSQPPPRPK